MLKPYFISILILTAISCAKKPEIALPAYSTLDPAHLFFADTVRIVFVEPDKARTNSLLKASGEEEFMKSLSTAIYYNEKFKNYLTVKHIKYAETNRRFTTGYL